MVSTVLVSDPVSEACLDLLRCHGLSVTAKYKLPSQQLLQEIKDYDGLIVRSETKVTEEVLEAGCKLKVVGRAGTGVDNIDLNAATQRGVIVLNTPGGNSISACELTCALISALARNIGPGYMSLKQGKWDRKLFMGSELFGKTLAVIGLGRIGREVALRMQSYGMVTVGFDPIVSREAAAEFNVRKMELDEIWPIADFITVHTPLIPQTRNLINKETLSKCKRGVKIINVARGGIVDEVALLEALKDGRCGGAGIDVFTEEPPKSQHIWDLINHPRVLPTPHLGASTEEAQVRVAVEIAEQFIALTKPDTGFQVTGAVNAPTVSLLNNPKYATWLDLAGQLGTIVGKFVKHQDLNNVYLNIKTKGEEKVKFVEMGVVHGVLSTREENHVNLINCMPRAKLAGLSCLEYSHSQGTASEMSVEVVAGQTKHVVTGRLDRSEEYLVSIDDAVFAHPTLLHKDSNLIRIPSSLDVGNVMTAVFQKTGIDSLSVARGKSEQWLYIVPTVKTSFNIPSCVSY